VSRGTPLKCIRIADALWQQFGEIAAANGTTRTELLRQWVRQYVETNGKRPK